MTVLEVQDPDFFCRLLLKRKDVYTKQMNLPPNVKGYGQKQQIHSNQLLKKHRDNMITTTNQIRSLFRITAFTPQVKRSKAGKKSKPAQICTTITTMPIMS